MFCWRLVAPKLKTPARNDNVNTKSPNMTESYFAIGLIGLFGGLHCVSMCFGLVAMLDGALSPQIKQNPSLHRYYHLSYNLGRISSYVLLGLVFGLIGTVLSSTVLTSALRVFSGGLMVMMGLYLANWWLGINRLEKLGARLTQSLQQKSAYLPINTLFKAVMAGMLWGSLPCGLVYSALALTLTNSQSECGTR